MLTLAHATVALGFSLPRAQPLAPATAFSGGVGLGARSIGWEVLPSRRPRLAVLRMQEEGGDAAGDSAVALLSKEASIYDEFLTTDASTGERVRINLAEKEKLYLDCLDAFYNEGKQILADSEYE